MSLIWGKKRCLYAFNNCPSIVHPETTCKCTGLERLKNGLDVQPEVSLGVYRGLESRDVDPTFKSLIYVALNESCCGFFLWKVNPTFAGF